MLLAITPRYIEFKAKTNFSEFQGVPKTFVDMCHERLSIQLVSIYGINYEVLDLCDGLILTGSSIDINPEYYGSISEGYEAPLDEYSLDKQLLDYFISHNKPVLGVCGGLQSLNVYYGGTLSKYDFHYNVEHLIHIRNDSFLWEAGFTNNQTVNSFHRLCIDKLGKGLRTSGYTEDGVVEAIESEDGLCIGVQWHSEEMQDDSFERLLRYFRLMIERGRE